MSLRVNLLFSIAFVTGIADVYADNIDNQEIQYSDALVNVGTVCMRSEPRHSSEMVSQAVMGTPLSLLERIDDWWLVESPEGYRGYVINNGILPMTPAEAHRWRGSKRGMYTSVYTGRIVSPDGHGTPVSDIHSGSIVEIVEFTPNDSVDIQLPDGRKGRLASGAIRELNNLNADHIDTSAILNMAKSLMGVAYLWGGTTPAGMDCSGLVKICYLNQGIILPRDASQQALCGLSLGEDYHNYQQGDLIFFKSAKTGNIIHVAIYDHDGQYIHSSGRVKINSLDSTSPLYIQSNIPAGACRIAGQVGSTGISTINRHPAYFN